LAESFFNKHGTVVECSILGWYSMKNNMPWLQERHFRGQYDWKQSLHPR
jgi:hypothetical protein